jgi:hypothetical protein
VSHTSNPSYLGGRDQEYHGSKPAGANSLQDLMQNRAGGVAQGLESLSRKHEALRSSQSASKNINKMSKSPQIT